MELLELSDSGMGISVRKFRKSGTEDNLDGVLIMALKASVRATVLGFNRNEDIPSGTNPGTFLWCK